VNLSAFTTGLVPPVVVTVTSTLPADCAGAMAVIVASDSTWKSAKTVPKSTALAPVNPLPLTVTLVPPVVSPDVGLRPVTAGPGGGGLP